MLSFATFLIYQKRDMPSHRKSSIAMAHHGFIGNIRETQGFTCGRCTWNNQRRGDSQPTQGFPTEAKGQTAQWWFMVYLQINFSESTSGLRIHRKAIAATNLENIKRTPRALWKTRPVKARSTTFLSKPMHLDARRSLKDQHTNDQGWSQGKKKNVWTCTKRRCLNTSYNNNVRTTTSTRKLI